MQRLDPAVDVNALRAFVGHNTAAYLLLAGVDPYDYLLQPTPGCGARRRTTNDHTLRISADRHRGPTVS
ncbi:MAG TPA: hypothetical protein VK453_23140 [Micromonosporaceae bacterium]|nr:hypothetical protein [Micromonosporaceae bacterium]